MNFILGKQLIRRRFRLLLCSISMSECSFGTLPLLLPFECVT